MAIADAAVAVNRDLQRMLAERIAAQEMQRRAEMEQARLSMQERQLTQQGQQFDARLGLDRDQMSQQGQQFSERLGLDREEFTAGAPERDARSGFIRTQTRDLEQKPLYAEADRQAEEAAAQTQHGYRLGEIRETGAQQRQTAAIRTGPGTAPVTESYVDERQGRLRDAVTDALGQVGPMTAGLGGKVAGMMPGSRSVDLSAQLDQIAANVAFNELQEMRNASKTGGALGQVSERELTLLSSVLGSLRQDQSPDALKGQLGKILESLDRWEDAKAVQGAGRPMTPTTGPPNQSQELDYVPGKGFVPRGGQ